MEISADLASFFVKWNIENLNKKSSWIQLEFGFIDFRLIKIKQLKNRSKNLDIIDARENKERKIVELLSKKKNRRIFLKRKSGLKETN